MQPAILTAQWVEYLGQAELFSTPSELGGLRRIHAWALPVGAGSARTWRAFVCIPIPLMLQGAFESLADAIAAIDQVMEAGVKAGDPGISSPADDVWDTSWVKDRRGDVSRRAAGAAITVKHEWGGYVCTIGGERFGPTLKTAQRACDWFDQRLPPPHPHHYMRLIPQRLRDAVHSAAQEAAGEADRFAGLFAERAMGALYLLREAGMENKEETALIAALVTGGSPVLWEVGYAGVVV